MSIYRLFDDAILNLKLFFSFNLVGDCSLVKCVFIELDEEQRRVALSKIVFIASAESKKFWKLVKKCEFESKATFFI